MSDKLLFVARRPPFPLANGARIRSHRLLTGLAEAFETTFLTFEHEASSAEGHISHDQLEAELPGVRVVTVPGRRAPKRPAQLMSLASRRSWEFGRYASEPLTRAIATAVGDGTRLIHFDDLGVALAGPAAGAVNVYSAHNVEQRILQGTVEGSDGVRRVFARADLRKVRREETHTWRSMALCLAVSPLDADAMREHGARVAVCPNGADPVDPLPLPARRDGEPLRMLFVGSIDYGPNYTGITWFVEEVLPRLRESMPATLDVVGSRRRALPAAEGVVYHGQVPSVEPFYDRAHVAVVPVRFGSGTRLKVVEAMALGRPVVATSVGAEGLPVVAGVDYLCADDPVSFAAALSRIARQTAERSDTLVEMLTHARRAVNDLSWPQIVSRLVSTYEAELRRHAGEHHPAATGERRV